MPTYVLHGFRWPRRNIRYHVVLENIDDAAPEWLIAPGSTLAMLNNFRRNWPDIMHALPDLRFIEQHDPRDETIKSQPWAYVADVVHEVRLGENIANITGKGVSNEQWTALVELRDKLCPEEETAWFVVVCGDEERLFDSPTPPRASTMRTASTNRSLASTGWSLRNRSASQSTWDREDVEQQQQQQHQLPQETNGRSRSNSISRGLKKVFGKKELRKSKSLKSLRTSSQPVSPTPHSPPPPLPYVLPGTAR